MNRCSGKLRIAWSATWSLAAILLIALWVRSYWQLDLICKCDNKSIMTTIGSQCGLIYLAHFDAYRAYKGTGNSYASHDWEYRTHESYALDRRLWESDSKGFLVNLPHWLFITVFASLAVAPWMLQVNWRFSLRTLLTITTLIAIALGLIVAML